MSDSTTSTVSGESPARSRRTTTRRPKSGARRKSGPRKRSRAAAGSLEKLLRQLSTRASRAGSAIAAGASDGASSARAALGKAKNASQSAIRASIREWKKLDTPRKVEFVATLLSALAAASGTIASRGRKKRKLFR